MTDTDSNAIDVLVLGGCGVDTIVRVSQLPLPLADSYLVPAIHMRAGQTGDNVALGLHALGLRTHHLDLLGDDAEGELVRALHRAHGVPLTTAPLAAGTRRAVNLVDPDGRRLSLYDGSRSSPDPLPEQTLLALARRSRHAHVSITQPWGESIAALRGAGTTLSTDLHDWDGSQPYQETFAREADLVFLSAAKLASPLETIDRIAGWGRARVVVATDGARGLCLWHAGHIEHITAATPSAPVVDSNGAGDAFVAGFLFGWLHGRPPRECAVLGTVAGAFACTVAATSSAVISRDELLAAAASIGMEPYPYG
jgi:sugar/nucleoside kinase (ribokinase family)